MQLRTFSGEVFHIGNCSTADVWGEGNYPLMERIITPRTWECSYCGSDNNDGTLDCPHCGANRGKAIRGQA